MRHRDISICIHDVEEPREGFAGIAPRVKRLRRRRNVALSVGTAAVVAVGVAVPVALGGGSGHRAVPGVGSAEPPIVAIVDSSVVAFSGSSFDTSTTIAQDLPGGTVTALARRHDGGTYYVATVSPRVETTSGVEQQTSTVLAVSAGSKPRVIATFEGVVTAFDVTAGGASVLAATEPTETGSDGPNGVRLVHSGPLPAGAISDRTAQFTHVFQLQAPDPVAGVPESIWQDGGPNRVPDHSLRELDPGFVGCTSGTSYGIPPVALASDTARALTVRTCRGVTSLAPLAGKPSPFGAAMTQAATILPTASSQAYVVAALGTGTDAIVADRTTEGPEYTLVRGSSVTRLAGPFESRRFTDVTW